jgi:hypothetical protein
MTLQFRNKIKYQREAAEAVCAVVRPNDGGSPQSLSNTSALTSSKRTSPRKIAAATQHVAGFLFPSERNQSGSLTPVPVQPANRAAQERRRQRLASRLSNKASKAVSTLPNVPVSDRPYRHVAIQHRALGRWSASAIRPNILQSPIRCLAGNAVAGTAAVRGHYKATFSLSRVK